MSSNPQAEWTANCQTTKKRRDSLEAYFVRNVLDKRRRRFICAHECECRSSHAGCFYKGQLHHLGSYYDLQLGSAPLQPIPLRAVIVGQEYGHGPSCVSLDDRHEMIMNSGLKKHFQAGHGFPARNPHMRGTTSLLRLLFGVPLGVDHKSEFVSINGKSVHMFDACAIVNFLLCSAVPRAGGTHGMATATMRRNCLRHFTEALQILEPNAVFVQGKGFWPWVRRAFTGVVPLDGSRTLFNASLRDTQVLIATFSHPSAFGPWNWGANERMPYLVKTVRPTVERLRRELGLQ